MIAFKVAEFALFFLIPVLVQIALYVVIARKLFVGSKDLHRPQQVCYAAVQPFNKA